MKPILILFFLTLSFSQANAQTVTTVILVRHGEKSTDDPKDPELSEAGKQRAQQLMKVLKEIKVDAIYATPYKRTRNTVAPLANAKGLTVSNYDPSKKEEIDQMLQKFAGGTIVIAGHSNTVPGLANYLTGKNELQNFDDTDYDNLLIVTVIEKGKTAKLVWLTY
ncbi:MAG TPA: phosphoglycerate mutase family protein [Cyclobacteriaceae bacterium]|jgi:broad specificity phosphatase PhoE|nr:histidine phosphatase family protein [Cytophagales bacterium]HNT50664.1 phosphoglycerate mutase family protein [Cyclobacteriaceae bacterium]HRE66170.1 phosphoglycerate mutase family protein [Cyclobacteriaceae bacterium]HRF32139.1 phosphoglycerate mutase family protein [Cyclobacteriaceae bacterium]